MPKVTATNATLAQFVYGFDHSVSSVFRPSDCMGNVKTGMGSERKKRDRRYGTAGCAIPIH